VLVIAVEFVAARIGRERSASADGFTQVYARHIRETGGPLKVLATGPAGP